VGEVISLDERRSMRRTPIAPARPADAEGAAVAKLQPVGSPGAIVRRPATFYFDPVAPESYLAAERVERFSGDVTWVPVAALGLPVHGGEAARRQAITARAAALRLPLVWPEPNPGSARATRVATLAVEHGVVPAFALAAGRLAYCGGFDLDDPEILAEAAAAAGLGIDACLRAAAEPQRDLGPLRLAEMLVARGADRLPCFEVGTTLFSGEERMPEALAAVRAPLAPRRAPRAG